MLSESPPTKSNLTANFLLSSHISHLNLTPDPPSLMFLNCVSQPKPLFYKAFISHWLLSGPAEIGRICPLLADLCHRNDCMSLCTACSDSQICSWRRDILSICLMCALFHSVQVCFVFLFSSFKKRRLQVSSETLQQQNPLTACHAFVWYQMVVLCSPHSMGNNSLKRMIRCRADDISAWCPAIRCALPGRTCSLLYPAHSLCEGNN